MQNSRTNYSNAPSIAIGFIYMEVFHSRTLFLGSFVSQEKMRRSAGEEVGFHQPLSLSHPWTLSL